MKKKCNHHYWAPLPNLRLCYKCGESITLWPTQAYSHEEFRKMYPLKQSDESIIFNYKFKK